MLFRLPLPLSLPPSLPPSFSQQSYPETGVSTAPSFTKYETLGEDNLDAWVENGFGEMDDVEASPVAYTIEGGTMRQLPQTRLRLL